MSTTIFRFFKFFCEQDIFPCFRNFYIKVSARIPVFKPFSQRFPHFAPYQCPLLAVWGHGLQFPPPSGLHQTHVFIIFTHKPHFPIRIDNFHNIFPSFASTLSFCLYHQIIVQNIALFLENVALSHHFQSKLYKKYIIFT